MKLDSQGAFDKLVANLNLKIRISKWRFQFGGRNAKSGLIQIEIGTRMFLGLLMENPISKCSNTNRWFQYGGSKWKTSIDADKTHYSLVFWITDYESGIDIYEFEIAVKLSTQGLFRTLITNRRARFKQS